jgi:hypothetical protein
MSSLLVWNCAVDERLLAEILVISASNISDPVFFFFSISNFPPFVLGLSLCVCVCVRLNNKPTNEPTVIDFLSPIFPSALLSGTLRTIQRAACDGETLTLRCPLGTAVSIQLAQYGRPAPGVALCSQQQQHPPDPPALASIDGNQLQQQHNSINDTCTLTPQMQVFLQASHYHLLINRFRRAFNLFANFIN